MQHRESGMRPMTASSPLFTKESGSGEDSFAGNARSTAVESLDVAG